VLAPLGMSPWFLGFATIAYGAVAGVLGGIFLMHAIRTMREAQDEQGRSLVQDAAARRTFGFSLLYLFALFGALALDKLVLGA
jgi:protoheme IX farnesyltransferase